MGIQRLVEGIQGHEPLNQQPPTTPDSKQNTSADAPLPSETKPSPKEKPSNSDWNLAEKAQIRTSLGYLVAALYAEDIIDIPNSPQKINPHTRSVLKKIANSVVAQMPDTKDGKPIHFEWHYSQTKASLRGLVWRLLGQYSNQTISPENSVLLDDIVQYTDLVIRDHSQPIPMRRRAAIMVQRINNLFNIAPEL